MKFRNENIGIFIITIVLYFTASLLIFNKVYSTSKIVIDELFHIPQGIRYCLLNFDYWDPKITTLPGLYLTSTVLIAPLFKCNSYNLRLVNLIFSCINLYLIGNIIKDTKKLQKCSIKNIIQSLNISLLPPLYFFAHVYYTDVISLTFILLLLNNSSKHNTFNSILSIIYGFCSVMVRQTNVIWVAFILGVQLCDTIVFDKINRRTENYSVTDVFKSIRFHLSTRFKNVLQKLRFNKFISMLSLFLVLLGFIIFVFINGSIVVGDKTAHSAAVHIPQLFYFLLFWGFFSVPYLVGNFGNVCKIMSKNILLIFFLIITISFIIHYNTLVHPYLLADNRHYTFYVWNKFFGRYWFAKYSMAPVYAFLLICFYENLKQSVSGGFVLSFSVCLFISVALQKMIEVRYFLVPFVITKMYQRESSWSAIALDLLINLIVNAITLKIFFTKEIVWSDFDDVQRLIW